MRSSYPNERVLIASTFSSPILLEWPMPKASLLKSIFVFRVAFNQNSFLVKKVPGTNCGSVSLGTQQFLKSDEISLKLGIELNRHVKT